MQTFYVIFESGIAFVKTLEAKRKKITKFSRQLQTCWFMCVSVFVLFEEGAGLCLAFFVI